MSYLNTYRELNLACKEYYLSIGKFQKSDRIHITSILTDFNYLDRYVIRVKKCFNKGNSVFSLYLNKNVLDDWYNLKHRSEKILRIKSRINQK